MESLEKLKEITAVLRSPEGCPWDRQQNFRSMREHLLEETFEVIEAVDQNDMTNLREELGDLLFLIFFYSRLAEEQGLFQLSDIAVDITAKLVRRHPHVFGDVRVEGVEEILQNWEKIKHEEKGQKPKNPSLMDGVARHSATLHRALKSQERAAKVNFDWQHSDEVFQRLEQESAELQEAVARAGNNQKAEDQDPAPDPAVEDEVGDILFTVINLARKLGVDPDIALNRATDKFQHRFRLMEDYAASAFVKLSDLNPRRQEELWQRAKKEIQQKNTQKVMR